VAVDINQVVDRAVFLTKHKLELAEVGCELELEEDMPTVRADSGQIQQAVMALLINAGEAVEKGGRVLVQTATCVEGVEIAVEDNGPGMEPDVARRVFEPFFTTKDGSSGVGLGLAVVYGIMERHGGSVELTTAPGKGCRFALVLPIDGPESDNEEGRA
jgi:signal transduction histidine kinase